MNATETYANVGLSKKLDVWIKPIDQNIAINMFSARKLCIPIAFDFSTWGRNKTCFCGF